jgi:WhiB family redox-sensing transcriptional regulator
MSGDWRDRALCAETDPEAFFPDKGGSIALAKRTCFACEVRAECLAWALEHDEMHGVWGGLSYPQRLKLKHGREAA